MRGWFDSTFGAGALAAQFVVALIVVIVLFGIIAAFARRRKTNAGPARARGRQPRLAVMDMADVDERRKLLLIRRDNVEHLVMIGGPSDLVIESAIVRNRPAPPVAAPQVGERGPDRAADRATARLAMQTQSRSQIRAPSAPAAGSEAASGDGSGNGSAEAGAAPPVPGTQFVNPYKLPELTREEKTPGSPAIAGNESPAPAPVQSAQAVSPAAVAGLAAGAAALTAAAASVKRREPSPESPPELPAKATPVLPSGFNGSDGMTTPAADALSGAATPEPAAPEPATSEDAAKGAKEPDAKTTIEAASEPDVAAEVTNGATPPAGTDTVAEAESEETAASQTPVAEQVPEPVEAAEPAQTESAYKTGETDADESLGESPGKSQPEDTEDSIEADAADETGVGDNEVEDNIAAALAEALAPAQDQLEELADTSAEAAAELTAETDDTATETATETTTEAATAAGPAPAKSFEEIMAEHAGDGDAGIATPPQTDAPASPEPETAQTSADTEADTAGEAAAPVAAPPVAAPPVERSAAISPFPTIPEDVRRSVLEAARRAEGSPDAEPAMADGGAKTTLGDLAERLEQALAEQASTLSGQLQPTADAKPAPSPAHLKPGSPGPARGPAASIEAWESGELAASGPQAAGAEPDAASSPAAKPDAAPRQSQAMLEDETDSGVIDFSDRKKASPENKPSDSLEDEMARLLGELTGKTSGR